MVNCGQANRYTPTCIERVHILVGDDVMIFSMKGGDGYGDLDPSTIKYRIFQKGAYLTSTFKTIVVKSDNKVQVSDLLYPLSPYRNRVVRWA